METGIMFGRRQMLALGGGLLLSSGLSPVGRAAASGPTAVVKTSNGPVRGTVEAGVQTFRGLRYGAPPVGGLRFMPPRKPKPWTEVADATHFGAPSMQLNAGGRGRGR